MSANINNNPIIISSIKLHFEVIKHICNLMNLETNTRLFRNEIFNINKKGLIISYYNRYYQSDKLNLHNLNIYLLEEIELNNHNNHNHNYKAIKSKINPSIYYITNNSTKINTSYFQILNISDIISLTNLEIYLIIYPYLILLSYYTTSTGIKKYSMNYIINIHNKELTRSLNCGLVKYRYDSFTTNNTNTSIFCINANPYCGFEITDITDPNKSMIEIKVKDSSFLLHSPDLLVIKNKSWKIYSFRYNLVLKTSELFSLDISNNKSNWNIGNEENKKNSNEKRAYKILYNLDSYSDKIKFEFISSQEVLAFCSSGKMLYFKNDIIIQDIIINSSSVNVNYSVLKESSIVVVYNVKLNEKKEEVEIEVLDIEDDNNPNANNSSNNTQKLDLIYNKPITNRTIFTKLIINKELTNLIVYERVLEGKYYLK